MVDDVIGKAAMIVWPVMKAPAALARKATTPATSWGSPTRRKGVICSRRCMNA